MIVLAILIMLLGLLDIIFHRKGAEMAANSLRGPFWKSVERSAEAWRPTALAIGVFFVFLGAVVLTFAIFEA